MEIDAMEYISKQKKSGEYEKQIQQDKQKMNQGKMETLKINSVLFSFNFSRRNF